MPPRIFIGFGMGPIQAGLFAREAYRTGEFDRIVVAEIDQDLVKVIRENNGSYTINIACEDELQTETIAGIEILNPTVASDRDRLLEALEQATDIATALPSISIYSGDDTQSVASLLARGLASSKADATLIYAGENHHAAAEALQDAVEAHDHAPYGRPVQFVNTVIGKMSQVIDAKETNQEGLAPVTPASPRAYLVESFNRILVGACTLKVMKPAIDVFEEKADLQPFEEAKLYGHNATHALMGYLLQRKQCTFMSGASDHLEIIDYSTEAFLTESGDALCKKHAGIDPLFTLQGYAAYVDDLMVRMVNPFLQDKVERVTRDPKRKLGWDDRLVGTMRVALSQGITPERYATGAAAAFDALCENSHESVADIKNLWPEADKDEASTLAGIINHADPSLV